MSMTVSEAVSSRRSIRAFKDTPVSLETVTRILEKARMAPSGCNYQPWEATVLTGAPLKALQEVLLGAKTDDPLEYRFDLPGEREKYKARLSTLGAAMYGAMQIDRGDSEGRVDFAQQNLTSFGAPVLILVHFPKLMGAAQWSDVGMWLQTIMLLVREEGLDTCPQEWFGVYGRTIKAHLGLDMDDTVLFCGLSIGERVADAAVNVFERERVPLSENTTFLGF